jgi:hypothetical protein
MAAAASRRAQAAMTDVSATVTAARSESVDGQSAARGSGSEVPMVQQTNNFAHLDPDVAVQMTKNDLDATLRRFL